MTAIVSVWSTVKFTNFFFFLASLSKNKTSMVRDTRRLDILKSDGLGSA